MPRFLFYFAYTLQTFRVPELIAVADECGVEIEYDKQQATGLESSDDPTGESLLVVTLKSREDAKKLLARSVLIKTIYEIFGEGGNYEELKQNLSKLPDQEFLDGKTWKMEFEAFGRGYVREEQLEKRHSLKGVPFLEKGKVRMKNPDKVLCIIEDVGILRKSTENARTVYFGEIIGEASRGLIYKYDLKKRPFLGTTTMDPELSLISANMAKARPGTLIYDPFVGTGSLLLACAHFGAHVMGADIDVRAVRNPSPKMRVEANFVSAGLGQYLTDVFLGDQSKRPLRSVPIFDAIVTDPPYGIRAGARKVGRKNKPRWKPIPEGFLQNHFPQCIGYKVSDVLRDLLSLAARMLRMDGRLVYWLPTTCDYTPSDLPLHPCLRMVANSDQKMSSLWSRRLITMEKYREFSDELDNLDPSAYGQTTMAHDNLRNMVFFGKKSDDPNAPLSPGAQNEEDDDEEEEGAN